MHRRQIILASASPRRKELLETMGILFDIVPAQKEERAQGTSQEIVCALARQKAEEVAEQYPDSFVIGADTIVCIDAQVLGKPKNREDAFAMLKALRGRQHHVLTAVCVYSPLTKDYLVEYDTTAVYFEPVSDAEISAYLDTDEPYDKAGAYALQGRAGSMIQRIEGCASNVIGLPMPLLKKMLIKTKAIPDFGE